MNSSINQGTFFKSQQINNTNKLYEEVPNQHSFIKGKVRRRVNSSFLNKETCNMPQEFGKVRPEKLTHSRTMTP
ncbi:MAG: hypothetical protein E7159_02050 [Firmicutes bacterium]|nr:hypothetical protein [Bacillota bacterium]